MSQWRRTKMAPTSEERREVAERLRATKAECEERGYPWLVEDLLQALGFETYEDGDDGIFDRLADLIDPTCTSVLVKDGLAVWRKCSMCGEPLDSHANYCPNCGARVVNSDDQ